MDPHHTTPQRHFVGRQAREARDNAEIVLDLMRATLSGGTEWDDDELIVACVGRLRQLPGTDRQRADALSYVVAVLAAQLVRADLAASDG